jgi:hypothetical protein
LNQISESHAHSAGFSVLHFSEPRPWFPERPRVIAAAHAQCVAIARALLEGDQWTRITIFRLDPGMDTGPILVQRLNAILADGTGALSLRLSRLRARASGSVPVDPGGKDHYTPQSEGCATYAPLLQKDDGLIAWSRPADQCRTIRARDESVARRDREVS